MGPQLFVGFDKCGDLAQVLASQLVESFDAGTVIGLGKHHVECHDCDLVLVEKLRDEARQHVARPGPAGDLLEAPFIDVENDDPLVDPARHCDLEPGIENDVVELGDDSHLVEFGGVSDEKKDDDQSEDDTDQVLFHSVSGRRRRVSRSAYVLMKNSIFTPASSIRS